MSWPEPAVGTPTGLVRMTVSSATRRSCAMSAATGGARMENIQTERESIEVRTLAYS
jgi:hypothetical protein